MQVLTSWDDGTKEDLKVMELLKKYKLPGIFFIPIQSWGFENLKEYKGFEIGGHTWTHPQDLKKLIDDTLYKEIYGARDVLRKASGQLVEGFCYPRGRYNDRVIKEVKEAGFKYARTTKVEPGITKLDEKPFEQEGFHCFQRKEYTNHDWLDHIIEMFKYYGQNHYNYDNFHIWGHSWEIEKYKEWDKLEELFKYIATTAT